MNFNKLKKILLKSNKPSLELRLLEKNGLLEEIFPEVTNLKKVAQGRKYHPEGNAFEHTMLALDILSFEERELDIMFAILLHDIGKSMVEIIKKGDHISFYGHEKAGSEKIKLIMNRITDDDELINSIEKLVLYHMQPLNLKKKISRKSIRRLSKKVDFIKLMKVHKSDVLGRKKEVDINYIDRMIKVYLEEKNKIKPLLNGNDLIELGMKPSKEFGLILKESYFKQIEEKIMDKEILTDFVRKKYKI